MLKKLTVAAALVAMAVPSAAQAQWKVFDSANYAQAIEQVRQAQQQIEEARRRLQEMQRLYDSVNGITDIQDVASIMNNPQLRGALPEGVTDVGDLVRQNRDLGGALGARADAILRETDYQLGSEASDAQREAFETAARDASKARALADQALINADDRAQGVGQLNDRLNVAETQKEVMAVQTRAAIEGVAASNETNRLIALEAAQRAEGERRSIERTALVNRQRKAASDYRASRSWGAK
ncbi:type IV secretion system protein [Alterisphingorhabdus coralli]|uniref:Type IV secretion system protein n=1 Tax=Alterisphingorhabdus coralli TaxID=3071408 RepID=A0AA97I1H1_9SPHN|nr:type IV secretion system protein [Parasphingorhabdus sp. SCSIO 66989]WOE76744.1 type IV secretion system protein [Parasphingorhabdus sp. SCSIO 66989]